ncbi:neocarzinostatin apoprotein domain-containing protein [Nocardia alba]|uniref:Neocarzinostatin family protein n=1 Tax=Nocardia alba TaxID=225051 RepID=A0A4R1FQF5_9NOCA|nr:neocarzinostatin apoprotein domain-containing protein [Nocardia alba]TCJ97117.1 neocarzinostatin family protein [Nocardia alba]
MKKTAIRCAVMAAATTAAVLGSVVAGTPHAAADVTVAPSANTGLSVGQSITVEVGGLPANLASVAVGQCKPAIVAPTDCNLTGSLLGTADDKGVWQPTGGKRTVTLIAAVGGTDCTTAAGACTLAVTSLTDPSKILASTPLAFGAPTTTPPPTTSVAAQPDSDDDDTNVALIVGVGFVVGAAVAVVATAVLRRRKS